MRIKHSERARFLAKTAMHLVGVVVVLLAAACAPLIIRAANECREAHEDSVRLADSPQCCNALLQAKYGHKQRAACEAARSDARVSVWLCAFERAWSRTVAYEAWASAVTSHWLLFGFGAVFVWAFAWAATQAWATSAQRALFREWMERMQPPAIAPTPSSFPAAIREAAPRLQLIEDD